MILLGTAVTNDVRSAFMKEYPQHISSPNMMDFISNDGGETYNR